MKFDSLNFSILSHPQQQIQLHHFCKGECCVSAWLASEQWGFNPSQFRATKLGLILNTFCISSAFTTNGCYSSVWCSNKQMAAFSFLKSSAFKMDLARKKKKQKGYDSLIKLPVYSASIDFWRIMSFFSFYSACCCSENLIQNSYVELFGKARVI